MRVLAIIVLVVSVVGCAVRPPVSVDGQTEVLDVADWSAPARPTSWTLNGRVALETTEEAGSASIWWAQSSDEYHLSLRGTLGVGSVDLQQRENQVILQTGDGERYAADSARELLLAVTGVNWPVEVLRFWVTGHPAPWLAGRAEVDEAGRVVELRQSGWVVQYDRYREVDGYQLPGRIWAEGHNSSLRLAVRDWSVGP